MTTKSPASPSRRFRLFHAAITFAALGTLMAACATGTNADFERDEDDAGQGAAGGGGEGGGEVEPEWPCGVDCSEIAAPDCHVSVCNKALQQCEVIQADNFTPCDDGTFCTAGEFCTDGLCGGGGVNDCGMEIPPCSQATCDEQAQTCSTAPVPDGTSCPAADLCTVNATCQLGQCLGNPKDCTFAPTPNECWVAECDPTDGTCQPEPGNEGLTCADSADPCTIDKVCDDGGDCIEGDPKDCSAFADYCNAGLCDGTTGDCYGEPTNLAGFCEDGDSCTTGESCDAGGGCAGGQEGLVAQEVFSAKISKTTVLGG